MKVHNRQIIRVDNSKYTIDNDGFMRVGIVMLKEGVFDYNAKELDQTAEDKLLKVFIPASEFTEESVKSASGKDITYSQDHKWRDLTNSLTDGETVGNIVGTPEVKDGKIFAEIIIKNASVIEKIKNKELKEVSAGYDAEFIEEIGEYDGVPYSHKQTNLHFNHVLLLPEGKGRCGSEVKIINKKDKEKTKMPFKIKYKIGNSTKEVEKTVEFENEGDALKAEAMVDEVKNFSASEVENAMEEIKNLKDEIESKNSDLEEKTKIIEEFKNKLEEALSPEMQEQLAEELVEQKEAEEEVVEAEFENSEKEEVKNSLKAMNRRDRMTFIAKKVLNKKGLQDSESLSEERLLGAFLSMAAEAKATKKIKNTNPMAKVLNKTSANSTVSTHDRMFSFKKK